MRVLTVLPALLLTAGAAPVAAHPAVLPGELAGAWTFEPGVVLTLMAALLLYARGLHRVWRSAGEGRGVRHWQSWCFAGGMLVLTLSLVSPLHALGGALFSAHMSQHVLLMSIAAPLIVLGAPLTAFTWALPRTGRRNVSRVLTAAPVRSLWHGLTRPATAWLLHAAAIWVWHVPLFYSATVSSDWVHTAQHASFFGTALLFWWALRDRATHGLGVLYLFTTAVHSSLLGALLAFSPGVYYTPYELTAPLWGISALEDQQLGGLIMWVPAGTVYFAAALALLASWLRTSERRANRFAAAGAVAMLLLVTGCRTDDPPSQRGLVRGGDPERGRMAAQVYGCGVCHEIRGVQGASGRVGPPLTGVAGRVYLAGYLPNQSENMVQWIMEPQRFRNPTAMPNLGVTERDARDITAYLHTLR